MLKILKYMRRRDWLLALCSVMPEDFGITGKLWTLG